MSTRPPLAGSDRLVRWVSLIVLAGSVGPMLETTVTSVAIDTLAERFGASVASIQWVSTAYLLALAMVIPLTGWLVERFGARRTWTAALLIFTVASVLCGAAWSTGSLTAFRILQGLGGGLTLPLAQTFLAQASGPERFGRALAFVAVPAQLAPIIGPVLGGVVIADLGWRWIFWMNVPLELAGLALARGRLPESPPRQGARLDVIGLVLLCPGLALLLLGLSEASGTGSGVTVASSLAMGTVLVAIFAAYGLRTDRTPLLDLRLFRKRSFTASTVTTFLIGLSLFGAMFLLPLYEQRARGHGVIDAGLLLAPQGAGAMAGLVLSARIAERTGPRRVVLAGLLMAMAGTVAWGYAGTNPNDLLLELSLAVRGAGLATAGVPAMAAAYRHLVHAEIPRATSALYSLQRLGGSVGTAALAVILQSQLAGGAGAPSPQVTHAFDVTFRWSIVLTGLALIPAALLPAGAVEPADSRPVEQALEVPALPAAET